VLKRPMSDAGCRANKVYVMLRGLLKWCVVSKKKCM
jgi:hypothetical protein